MSTASGIDRRSFRRPEARAPFGDPRVDGGFGGEPAATADGLMADEGTGAQRVADDVVAAPGHLDHVGDAQRLSGGARAILCHALTVATLEPALNRLIQGEMSDRNYHPEIAHEITSS